MTTDLDTTRIVRSWLEEGPTTLPEALLDDVLERLPTTPRRRALRPAWRSPRMSTQLKVVLAAAAVAAAAFTIGVPLATTIEGPGTVSSPSLGPSLTPVTTMVDTTSPLRLGWDLPPGWQVVADHSLHKGGDSGVAISATLVAGVYADPCHWSGLARLGQHPTVDETVAAIAAQPSRSATQPTDATLGGYPGKHLAISVPADAVFADCTQGQFRSYVTDDGGVRYHQGPGQIDELWVLEVGGTTVTVGASYFPQTPKADLAEMQAVVGSLRLIEPRADASPGRSPAASAPAYTWPGPLASGTYRTRFMWNAPVRITFTVPDGWESRDVEVVKHDGSPDALGVMFVPVGNVYSDPCGHVLSDPPIGPSVVDLTVALSHLPGIDRWDGPTPVAFADHQGEYLEFAVGDGAGCPGAAYRLWDAVTGSVRPEAGPSAGTQFWSERPLHRVWVLDIEGLRFLVDASSSPDATDGDLAELQSVIDSIRIERTTDDSSLGACTLELTQAGHATPLEPPYTVTMGPTRYELRGPVPVDPNTDEPLTPEPPIAQIDWTGDFGGASISGPGGATGFTTHMGVGGLQGSAVFDVPGTWLVTLEEPGCFRQFSVEVLPPPD